MSLPHVMLTRAEADAQVSLYAMPNNLVGTRRSPGEPWRTGSDRDLRHDRWLVRSGSRKRDGPFGLRFDSVIDVGGIRMSPSDALIKKTLAIGWIAGTTSRGIVPARSLSALCTAYDWIIRHRVSVGESSFADLQTKHFSDFRKRVADGGLAMLVPLRERIKGEAH